MEKIRGTIEFLTKGCSCKTGCTANKCGCRKRANYCGPGCVCQACTNLPVQQPVDPRDDDSNSSSSEGDDVTDDDVNSDEEIKMEIVTDEFYMMPQSSTTLMNCILQLLSLVATLNHIINTIRVNYICFIFLLTQQS